jgi:hypothetical protein
MAVSSQYIELLQAGINSSPEWKEAWERINDYLDALKTAPGRQRELITLTGFEQAIERKRAEPFTPATQLVFEETQKILDGSLGYLIGEDTPEHRRHIEERVRLYLTETVGQSVLGESDRMSPEIVDSLREVKLKVSPDLQAESLTPKPLEFNSVGQRLIAFAKQLSPVGANRVMVWIIVLIIVAVLIYVSR